MNLIKRHKIYQKFMFINLLHENIKNKIEARKKKLSSEIELFWNSCKCVLYRLLNYIFHVYIMVLLIDKLAESINIMKISFAYSFLAKLSMIKKK